MKDVLIYYNNDNLLYLIEELKEIYHFCNYSILAHGDRALKADYKGI